MSANRTLPWETHASDSESSHFLGSYKSSTETDSNIPGPGRLLGKAYSFIGRKAEKYLSIVAVKFGYGPRATAVKIRRLSRIRGAGQAKQRNMKKLERAGKQLVRHIRYAAYLNKHSTSSVIFMTFEIERSINAGSSAE